MGWLDDLVNTVGNAVESDVHGAKDWAESVGSDIESLVGDVEKATSEIASDAEDFVEEVGNDIEEGVEIAGEWVEETAKEAGRELDDFWTKSDADTKVYTRNPVFVPTMEHLGTAPTAQQATLDRTSRIKCNTGQYDQVVAISEDMLNAQLESYFEAEPKMQTMSQKDKFAGNIEAVMRAPRVSIAVKDQNRSSLDYHVRIESATIQTYPKSIRDVEEGDELEEWEIHDWEFVFGVNIAFEGMSKEDKDKMGPVLGVAGDYSIQRLLLQFGSADLSKWNADKSYTKMDDGDDPPYSIREKLDRWTSSWLAGHGDIENRLHGIKTVVEETVGGAKKVGRPTSKPGATGVASAVPLQAGTGAKTKVTKLNKTGVPILYHAMPAKPSAVNPVAPTFPPTAVTQQTYEFVRPDDGKGRRVRFPDRPNPKNESLKEQITKFNCLLYLETCGRELPSTLNFDESHGNFVTADGVSMDQYPSDLLPDVLARPQIQGSMCFKAEILFDSFLIPKFRPLVKETEVYIKSVAADANKSNNQLAFSWGYAFGGNPAHYLVDDVYFNLKRQNGADNVYDKWFNNKVDGIKNTNGWRWVTDEQVKQHESVEEKCWSWTAKRIWLSVTARSLCNLQHFPGTNKVKFTGITTIAVHMKDDRNCWFTADEDQVAITGIWSFDIFFKCGDSGRILIEVQWPDNPLRETNWVNPSGDHLRGISTTEIKEEMQSELKKKVNALKDHVKQIENALKDQCFVLSGGGYFFQRNPIFTERGDLIVELEYKGIPKDGTLRPPPPLGVVPAQFNVMPNDINQVTDPSTIKLKLPGDPLYPPASKDNKYIPKNVLKDAPQSVKDDVAQEQEAEEQKKLAQKQPPAEATRPK